MPDWILCDCPHCGNTLRLHPHTAEEGTPCPSCYRSVTLTEALAAQAAGEAATAESASTQDPPPGSHPATPWEYRRSTRGPSIEAVESLPPGEDGEIPGEQATWDSPTEPGESAEWDAPDLPLDEGETHRGGSDAHPAPPESTVAWFGDTQGLDPERLRKIEWTEPPAPPPDPADLHDAFADAPEPGDGSEAPDPSLRRKQRKRRFGFWGQTPDWEMSSPRHSDSKLEQSIHHLIRAGVALLAVGGLILLFILFGSAGRTGGKTDDASERMGLPGLTGSGNGADSLSEEERLRRFRDALILRPAESVATIRPAIERFLAAKSWEDRLGFVREPDRVRPLMRKFYALHPDGPLAYSSIGNDSTVACRDQFMVLNLLMKDYSTREIAVEYRNGQFLVDWESFVGFSELTPAQLKDARPVEPTLVRVSISVASPAYFNYAFDDESLLECFLLTFPDDSYLFAYAEKLTAVSNRVHEMLGDRPSVMTVVKVRYPEGAVAADQVWLTDVLAEGWVFSPPAKAPQP